MLFNSYIFIFAFLPLTVIAFGFVRKSRNALPVILLLVAASFLYYSYWNASHTLILLASIVVNYCVTAFIIGQPAPVWRRAAFLAGVTFNLGLLGYYKYAGFILDNVNATMDLGWTAHGILLPIGISFFTFQQIALLADANAGKVARLSPVRHAFFVTFFPQLIAGPIVHHAEIMPQLDGVRRRPWSRDLGIGLAIFAVGLFKKVVIADSMAVYADAGFGMVHEGRMPDMASAWIATLSYSFQIYYDFSGYSDMAVGLARMFGLKLPLNFYSPYRATGFIDFWRRWHITLSRFLRDYLYIPLGGNRHGIPRQYLALAAVMLLGGLWHGAGWSFVLWGGLHGLLLIANHAWTRLPLSRAAFWRLPSVQAAQILGTFVVVTIVWVPFRAPSLQDALAMWSAMFPLQPAAVHNSLQAFLDAQFGSLAEQAAWLGFFAPRELWPQELPADFLATAALPAGLVLALLAAATFFLPNTYQLFRDFDPALHLPEDRSRGLAAAALRPGLPRWLTLLAISGMFVVSILGLSHVSPFLYFQF